MAERPDFPEMSHTGLIVSNIEECVKRFTDVFGIDHFTVYDFKPIQAWSMGEKIEDCKLRIGMARLKSGSAIEVIQPVSGNTLHQRVISENGGGVHHIAFVTDEYDRWLSYYRSVNVPILFEAEAEDEVRGYRRCFYADDRELNCMVEIAERAKFRK
jgi:catechol 2,3-dioxygenase-like lactoylglutathione lyase family enzyme